MSQKDFPNLFLSIGAMKSGTTWLYNVLRHHPQLHFSPEKELHYLYHRYCDPDFLSDHKRLNTVRQKHLNITEHGVAAAVRKRLQWVSQYLDSPVDDHWYRAQFCFRSTHKYCCDFSNLYAVFTAENWTQIYQKTDDLKVIYTLRHPVERLWSHVRFHLHISGQDHLLKIWGPEEYQEFIHRDYIWPHFEYGRTLRSLKQGLPAQNFKVFFYEEICAKPMDMLENLNSFLEIAPHSYPDSLVEKRVNETRPHEMPAFFPDLIKHDVHRVVEELTSLGLDPPWTLNA